MFVPLLHVTPVLHTTTPTDSPSAIFLMLAHAISVLELTATCQYQLVLQDQCERLQKAKQKKQGKVLHSFTL